jgi:STE24 endopeptidase
LANEDKSALYHRLKRRSDLLGTAATAGVLAALVATGASLTLREVASFFGMAVGLGYEESLTVVALAIILTLLLFLVELPFAFYQGFKLEHRFALSTESLRQWTVDQLKALALAMVFGSVAAAFVYWTIRRLPDWWWILAAAGLAAAMVALVHLAPVLLLPMFRSFKPLERQALVDRLVVLAARAGTRIGGVYEWGLSAHTKKANAALAGMGNTRRILLSDTLLADYSDDEIEVVLAHELSHHVHHDLWRGVAVQTAVLFVSGFVASVALRSLAGPLELRGLDDPAGLPVLRLAAGMCSLVSRPLLNALSRVHERRADHYALESTGRPAAFISAMRRLAQQNLAEENPSLIVRWLFYSHPPIRERIEAAKRWRMGRVQNEPNL